MSGCPCASCATRPSLMPWPNECIKRNTERLKRWQHRQFTACMLGVCPFNSSSEFGRAIGSTIGGVRLRTSTPSASERVLAASLSFSGTPLQVSGARPPPPPPGRVPVTLGTFDSISLIYTSLALALAKDFESFVSFLKNMLLDAVAQENHKVPTALPSFIVRAVTLGWLQAVDLLMCGGHEAAASGFFGARLRSGDILVFESTSMEATIADTCSIDKVAIAMNEAGSIFFCQAVGDYEIEPPSVFRLPTGGSYAANCS